MSFITREDYPKSVISDHYLDDLTEVDDEKIDECQIQAIEFISGYLNSRYDVAAIFSKTGTDRNPFILRIAMDIAIYFLHKMGNGSKIPASRKESYMEAKEWLEKVNEKRINPRDLPLLADGSRDDVMYGSNPPRRNHI